MYYTHLNMRQHKCTHVRSTVRRQFSLKSSVSEATLGRTFAPRGQLTSYSRSPLVLFIPKYCLIRLKVYFPIYKSKRDKDNLQENLYLKKCNGFALSYPIRQNKNTNRRKSATFRRDMIPLFTSNSFVPYKIAIFYNQLTRNVIKKKCTKITQLMLNCILKAVHFSTPVEIYREYLRKHDDLSFISRTAAVFAEKLDRLPPASTNLSVTNCHQGIF